MVCRKEVRMRAKLARRWKVFVMVSAAVSVYLLPERFVGPLMRRVSAVAARFLTVAGRLPAQSPDHSCRLKAEIAKLRMKLATVEKAEQMLGLLSGIDDRWRWLPARVVLRGDASDLRRSIIVTVGSRMGVDVGAPVVWGDPEHGAVLVGVVRQVYGWASRAVVVGDVGLSVAVETPSGASGLLSPRNGALLLRYLTKQPKDGESVLTSGRLGRLPAGLLVGTVHAVKNGDEVRFVVRPPFRPEEVPFVFVGVVQ